MEPDLFRSIADSAFDWIYLRDREGKFLFVSPSCVRITGHRPEEFKDDPGLLTRIVHPDDMALVRSHLDEAGSGRDVSPFDFRIITKDGATRWINHACSPVLDSEGRLLGRRATNRDISRRKFLEEEVQSLAKFPSENPNPVFRVSGEGAIMYANSAGNALLRALGCPAGAALPENLRLVVAQSFRDKSPRDLDVETEGRVLALAVVPPEGTSYLNIYGTDVTERRKAEDGLRAARDALEQKVRERTAQLRKSNRLLRMISACNQALVGIENEKELVQAICQLILDEGGFRMAWVGYADQDSGKRVRPAANAGFEDGYLDRAGITWADTERGRGPTGTAIRERRVCTSNDFLAQPELAPWRDDAVRRGFHSSIALPLVSEGRAFGALTIYSDLPSAFDQEQKTLLMELAGDLSFGIMSVRAREQRDLALAQLRSLAAELVHAEERERQRIGRILHDQLQQLLAGARFGLESLRAASKAENLRETVDKIDGMLKEGLEVSRSLTTELSPPIQYGSDVESLVRWLAAWAQERFGLTVTVAAQEDGYIGSDEIRMTLFRTVQELLFNVAKHAGVKEAHVSIRPDEGRHLLVAVSDCGAGFDPSALRARGGSSGGFGLFTIQERLQALGGSIAIESRPGSGSSFTIRVPAEAPGTSGQVSGRPAARRGTAVGAASGRRGGSCPEDRRIRVLLVDDHLVVRQGLAMVLGGEPDIEIVGEASDGETAVSLAAGLLPDVVTMDINLPGMSGIEATRVIHVEHPEISIIGLSMFEEEGDAMRNAGAVGYLSKTGPSAKLLEVIRSVCRKKPT